MQYALAGCYPKPTNTNLAPFKSHLYTHPIPPTSSLMIEIPDRNHNTHNGQRSGMSGSFRRLKVCVCIGVGEVGVTVVVVAVLAVIGILAAIGILAVVLLSPSSSTSTDTAHPPFPHSPKPRPKASPKGRRKPCNPSSTTSRIPSNTPLPPPPTPPIIPSSAQPFQQYLPQVTIMIFRNLVA